MNIVRTYNGGWSQMGFELGIPYASGATTIPAGSTIRATVEYLVPPADKDAYFGEADYLVEMPADDYQSTDMMWTLAADNHLEVTADVGEVLRVHPVELSASDDTTAVEFTLSGGLCTPPSPFTVWPGRTAGSSSARKKVRGKPWISPSRATTTGRRMTTRRPVPSASCSTSTIAARETTDWSAEVHGAMRIGPSPTISRLHTADAQSAFV